MNFGADFADPDDVALSQMVGTAGIFRQNASLCNQMDGSQRFADTEYLSASFQCISCHVTFSFCCLKNGSGLFFCVYLWYAQFPGAGEMPLHKEP